MPIRLSHRSMVLGYASGFCIEIVAVSAVPSSLFIPHSRCVAMPQLLANAMYCPYGVVW